MPDVTLHMAETRQPVYGGPWTWVCRCGDTGEERPTQYQARVDGDAHLFVENGRADAVLAEARRACELARFPEQHRDDCAWCAHVAAERAAGKSLSEISATSLEDADRARRLERQAAERGIRNTLRPHYADQDIPARSDL